MTHAGRDELFRFADAVFLRIELGRIELKVWNDLQDALGVARNPDYSGAVKARFDLLILQLVKFARTRYDAVGAKFPYLRRLEGGDPVPGEEALQQDLATFLATLGSAELEKADVASGRADIFLIQPSRPSFRFVIEVKRSTTQWNDEALATFLAQTTAYQQQDVRIGVLAVLDLSERPPGFPHFEDCFQLRERSIGSDRRHALVLRVPGNRRTPSDKSLAEAPG